MYFPISSSLLLYVLYHYIVIHRHMSSSDITAIQDALLRKCMDYGRVVHIVVDKRSLFVSVIYGLVMLLAFSCALCQHKRFDYKQRG